MRCAFHEFERTDERFAVAIRAADHRSSRALVELCPFHRGRGATGGERGGHCVDIVVEVDIVRQDAFIVHSRAFCICRAMCFKNGSVAGIFVANRLDAGLTNTGRFVRPYGWW